MMSDGLIKCLWFLSALLMSVQVHLMCLVASARFRNSLCSEPDLLAVTMSLLPAHFGAVAKERIDQNFLSGLHKWYVIVRISYKYNTIPLVFLFRYKSVESHSS